MKVSATQLSLPVDRLRRADAYPASLPTISTPLPSIHAGDFLILPENANVVATRRLVVLVPENELDERALAQRIWSLAAQGPLEVLFLALAPNWDAEAHLRRRLATLAALTGDRQVDASTQLACEANWVLAVEKVRQPGDLLICYDRHTSDSWRLQRQHLGAYLSTATNVPAYILVGLVLGPSPRLLNMVRELLALAASLFVIMAFAWLQIRIDQAMDGGLSTLMLCLTVFVEIACLVKLNDLVG